MNYCWRFDSHAQCQLPGLEIIDKQAEQYADKRLKFASEWSAKRHAFTAGATRTVTVEEIEAAAISLFREQHGIDLDMAKWWKSDEKLRAHFREYAKAALRAVGLQVDSNPYLRCTERKNIVSDFTLRSIKRRQQAWLEEMRQLQNDVDHWNRTHPNEKPIVIEPITKAEIESLRSAGEGK